MSCSLEGTNVGVKYYFSELGVENVAQSSYANFQKELEAKLEGFEVTSFSCLDDSEEADGIVIEAYMEKEKLVGAYDYGFDPFGLNLKEVPFEGGKSILILSYNEDIGAYGLYLINLHEK